MNTFIRRLSLIAFALGSLILYSGQRYGTLPSLSLMLGGLLILAAVVMDLASARKASGQFLEYLKVALVWKGTWIGGIALYFLSRHYLLAEPLAAKLLLASSAGFIALGMFLGFGIEVAALRSLSFDGQDAVRRRFHSSLSLGLLFIGLLGINYAANKKDILFDMSYLKVSAPGDATKKIVGRLEQPIRVGIFNSRDSEVLPMVREYFQGLPPGAVSFEYYDKDYNPMQADEFRVARNGQVVVMAGEKRQRFEIGDRMDEARRNLRTLDAAFQKAVLQLTSEPAIIYFTSTHGEMLWESGSPLRIMATFETLLRSQNYRARRLTALFQDVPPETKILGIIGPQTGFTGEETAALQRYLDRGGRLLIALDIDRADQISGTITSEDELPKFLAKNGLRFDPRPITHDERFVTSSRQKSDRYFIFSNNFTDHPAISTLKTNPDRLSLMSFRSGSWDLSQPSPDWSFKPVALSITGSFKDANGNFEAEPNEKRGNYPLVVAGESLAKGKLVAFADASIFSDTLMKVASNQFATLDAVRWLGDRSEQTGTTVSEEDVLIRHENSRELLVFHGSIYLIPLLVLIAGFYFNRKRGQA